MKAIVYTLLFVLFGFIACNNSNKTDQTEENTPEPEIKKVVEKSWYKPQRQVIRGYVADGANATIILDQMNIGNINPLVSVIVDENDSFFIETMVLEPSVYQLRFANGSIHLFLRGGEVKVSTDISAIGDYTVEGSEESVRLNEMYNVLTAINNKTYALQDRMDTLKKNKKDKSQFLALLDSLPIYYAAINKEKSERLREFVDKQDTFMIGLLAAMYLNADENYDYLIALRDKYEKICPKSQVFKQFDDKMSQVIPVSRGHEAPEIVIPDYNGNDQTLTDLRGNYTLIYFWASYSEPCRNDNKVLKRLFDQYYDKGFRIFTNSIDEDKSFWKDAILEDGIDGFVNGSNLAGWEDIIASIYKIEGIPYYVMLDKEGIIIYRTKNISEMETFINSVFNGGAN